MSARPTIFISTVSKELRGARQLVANTLTFLGYEPVWQDIFGTESGDVREMLRAKIDSCQGVVQLVGHAYGAEPATPDQKFGRCSYTQYEALYAREKGIKLWYLFMDEKFPGDSFEAEPEELRELQVKYRRGLKSDSHLFHELASNEALEAGVLKLRDDLSLLRRRARMWAVAIIALLAVIIGLSVWLLGGQRGVQQSVDDVAGEVRKGNEALATIAERFEALGPGKGLIGAPKTPEEHYHNARIHELGGNFSAARKEYTSYLGANLEALDPWLAYADMLKASEGRAGALETMRYFQGKLEPPTVSYRVALALLEEGEARMQKLQELAEQNPDFGPLPWLIAREYSPAKRGDQTIADQRAEKQWLEKFRSARDAGKFSKFFIDQKEAGKWSDMADQDWARLGSTPDQVLENPVTLTAQQSNAGWAVVFSVSDPKIKELFYQLDGDGGFKSTGHLPMKNPQTGMNMVNPHVALPGLPPGEHTIEVKYTDRNDATNGPFTLRFSTSDEQIAQGKMMLNAAAGSWLMFRDHEGKCLLYFTTLMSYRPILQEVRYSLNNDSLDRVFEFEPSTTMFEVGDRMFLTVPDDTEYAVVQVTFKDGTKSEPQKVTRK